MPIAPGAGGGLPLPTERVPKSDIADGPRCGRHLPSPTGLPPGADEPATRSPPGAGMAVHHGRVTSRPYGPPAGSAAATTEPMLTTVARGLAAAALAVLPALVAPAAAHATVPSPRRPAIPAPPGPPRLREQSMPGRSSCAKTPRSCHMHCRIRCWRPPWRPCGSWAGTSRTFSSTATCMSGIHRVQGQVQEERADHSALRSPRFGRGEPTSIHRPGLQPLPDQSPPRVRCRARPCRPFMVDSLSPAAPASSQVSKNSSRGLQRMSAEWLGSSAAAAFGLCIELQCTSSLFRSLRSAVPKNIRCRRRRTILVRRIE